MAVKRLLIAGYCAGLLPAALVRLGFHLLPLRSV